MNSRTLSVVLFCACVPYVHGTENDELTPLTVAEESDYQATSRSAEVVEFIDQLTKRSKQLRKLEFGRTVEDRPLNCVLVADPIPQSPADLADDPRAVVLVIGNIHSGECAGKEAMLMLLRELAHTPDHEWLQDQVLLFVPNYSADSNDMVSLDNRPGQIGPARGMGRRANLQGLDLNRDYMKLDSPECRALISLVNRWDPHVFIDMHTTNGSWHRYALTYDIPHNPASPKIVRTYMRQQMMPKIARELEGKNISAFYYGNFDREHTRWSTFGDLPRFGTEYIGLRGRMSILSEAYAYTTYKERIVSSREFLRECLDYIGTNRSTIRELLEQVRRAGQGGEGTAASPIVPIRSRVTPLEEKVTVRGYTPAISPRERHQTPTQPHEYSVEFYTNFVPTMTVQRPAAYLVPADQQLIVERLKLHGIAVETISDTKKMELEIYRIKKLSRRSRAYQNRHILELDVEPTQQQRQVAQGTHLIKTDQTLSNLIVYLLEPAANDGLAAWNVFEPELKQGDEFPVWRVPNSAGN